MISPDPEMRYAHSNNMLSSQCSSINQCSDLRENLAANALAWQSAMQADQLLSPDFVGVIFAVV